MDAFPGTPKTEFLATVRRALGRGDLEGDGQRLAVSFDSLEELEERAVQVNARLAEERNALMSRLAETAGLRGWNVCRAAGVEAAVDYICGVATAAGVTQAARSAQDVFQQAPVDDALRNLGIEVVEAARDEDRSRDAVRREIIASGLGVTGVDYAVAETGSVVVVPRAGLSRLVSLVPPVHVALVRPQDVVASLDDVFLLRRLEYYRNGGDMGSYLNFITGPSRTADIEQTIVIGVHGPREVHMVLLDQGLPG